MNSRVNSERATGHWRRRNLLWLEKTAQLIPRGSIINVQLTHPFGAYFNMSQRNMRGNVAKKTDKRLKKLGCVLDLCISKVHVYFDPKITKKVSMIFQNIFFVCMFWGALFPRTVNPFQNPYAFTFYPYRTSCNWTCW